MKLSSQFKDGIKVVLFLLVVYVAIEVSDIIPIIAGVLIVMIVGSSR